jgi:small-conductance mechanosensitive channel
MRGLRARARDGEQKEVVTMQPDWITTLSQPFIQAVPRIAAYLPNLLAAAALLLAGWVLARLLQATTTRVLGRLRWLVHTRPVEAALRRAGVERSLLDIVATIVFWVVLLLFFIAVTETLGLPVLATWLRGVSLYLPRVLMAVLIILAGVLGGNLVRDAVSTTTAFATTSYAPLLGRIAQVVIVSVAVVTAVDQIGIDSHFLTAAVMIVIGALVGGTALAFGLGARTAVSNIVACHYLRQTYRVGHTVRLGDVQGKILEITSTGVILEGTDGRVLIPASAFSEAVSVLVTTGG